MQAELRTALDQKLGNNEKLLLACAVQLTEADCTLIRRLVQQETDWDGSA